MGEAPDGARRQTRPTLDGTFWLRFARTVAIACTGGLSGIGRPAVNPARVSSGAEVAMEFRSSPPGAEPGVPTGDPADYGVYTLGEANPAAVDDAGLDDPKVLQILSTEHWSLLASRSLTWSESFSRTGLFLSFLSASTVALGLVGGATQFSSQFVLFALVILPVTLFVGIATFVRIDEANIEDVMWVVGMNRIRNAYVRVRPSVEPFLISGWSDDLTGVGRTFLMTSTPTRANTIVHQFVTTPGMVAVIDGALAGAIAGIAINSMAGMTPAIPAAIAIGAVTTGLLFLSSVRRGRRVMGHWRPRFPLPADAETGPRI